MKLPLNRFKIRINIGVIKLQIVYDLDFRAIVKKLCAFIEKRRIVFVRFDDENFTAPQPCRNSKILRYTAN